MKPPVLATYGLVLGLALLTHACGVNRSKEGGNTMPRVQVEAYYLERILLPPGAVLRVTLADVSRMDVAAKVISEVIVEEPGNPPYNVAIPYETADIQSKHRYALRGTIRVNDKLWFSSIEHIDAFGAGESGVVKLKMQRTATGP